MGKGASESGKNKLGTSDLYVSKLGLGCMSLGTNENKVQEIIETALEEGINYFDTADLYQYGRNESIVGKALKPVRDQVIIATKVGNRWKEKQKGWSWDPSKAYIKEAVKDSLRRLQTDYIDLYQLHGGTIDDPLDESIEAFEELKQEGYIKYYGISSIRPNVIKEFAEKSSIISVMMQYSLLDRRPEEEVMPILKKHHIAVVTRGSLAKGILSNETLKKATEKIKKNGYLNYSFQDLQILLKKIKEQPLHNERPMTEIALQFNLANDAVASVVAGASSVEQLKENVRAVQTPPLSEVEYQLLLNLTAQNKYSAHRLS